jgi:hypothetical protein
MKSEGRVIDPPFFLPVSRLGGIGAAIWGGGMPCRFDGLLRPSPLSFGGTPSPNYSSRSSFLSDVLSPRLLDRITKIQNRTPSVNHEFLNS